MAIQNQVATEIIRRERLRLSHFIRRRVPDADEAEDILQDVFFELVEAYRLPESIEQMGAWLFRVARNRIIDRFRKKREAALPIGLAGAEDDEDHYWLEQVLPDSSNGPESAYMRSMLIEAISVALAELPVEQRDVFIAHELDGLSFKEIAAQSGVNVNTLLGWKRQAVLHLRSRLKPLHDEFLR